MSNSSYDISQTSFLFSWLSNSSANTTDTAVNLADKVWSQTFDTSNENSLLASVGDQLYGGSDWSNVWGPAVYQETYSTVADNTAFVAYNATEDTYVIGVAGTNPKSNFAMNVEDLRVNQMISWPYDPVSQGKGKPKKRKLGLGSGQGAIAYGTAVGLYVLLTQLTLSSHANTKYSTLGEYLLSSDFAVKDGTKIIFAGHSLGGALAPTLANWLFYKKSSYKDNISSLIVAGPTVGESVYQLNWDSNFPQKTIDGSMRQFNTNISCFEDVVPHAWNRIFTPDPQLKDSFYFSGTSLTDFDNVNSRIGNIQKCRLVYEALVALQAEGTKNLYTETQFVDSYKANFPMNYYYTDPISKEWTEGTIEDTSNDTFVTIDDFSTFKAALVNIHIWSYGQDAFEIELGVLSSLIKL